MDKLHPQERVEQIYFCRLTSVAYASGPTGKGFDLAVETKRKGLLPLIRNFTWNLDLATLALLHRPSNGSQKKVYCLIDSYRRIHHHNNTRKLFALPPVAS